MERPITPSLLATFIEYAATERVTLFEWNRFAVTHYHDERMEKARHECVRILRSRHQHPLSESDIEQLYLIADNLRRSKRNAE